MSEKGTRYCFIEPQNGALAVAIKADNSIVAGANFIIFNPETKTELENWHLTLEGGNPYIHRVNIPILELNKLKMVWNILVCSKNANIFKGHVQVLVSQRIQPCKLSMPANYIISNIPPCSLNSSENFSGSMFFIIKKEVKL